MRPLRGSFTSEVVAFSLQRTAGHGDDKSGPLFRPISNDARGARAITPADVYKVMIRYASVVSIDVEGFGSHALCAAAATNALEHDANFANVQQLLRHANISTMRVYDRRQLRAKDGPMFRVAY